MNSNSGAYHSALEDLVPDSDHTDSSILYYGKDNIHAIFLFTQKTNKHTKIASHRMQPEPETGPRTKMLADLQLVFPDEDPKKLMVALERSSFDLEAAVNFMIAEDPEATSTEDVAVEAVTVMQDIFPHVTLEDIVKALKRFDQNIEDASNFLLASSQSGFKEQTGQENPDEQLEKDLLGLLLSEDSYPLKKESRVKVYAPEESATASIRNDKAAKPRAYRPPQPRLPPPAENLAESKITEFTYPVDTVKACAMTMNAPPMDTDGFHIVARRTARPFADGNCRAEHSGGGVRLAVLVGLPGSGKSTLARRFAARGWAVVCQDELGSRGACEAAADRALADGVRVVVDRTNIDPDQRAHWLRLARRHRLPDAAIACVVLALPRAACERRVLARRGHPTLPPNASSVDVIRRFAAQYQPPAPGEGFGRILVLGGGGGGDSDAALEELLG